MKQRIPILPQREQAAILQQQLREYENGGYQLKSDSCRQLICYTNNQDPLVCRAQSQGKTKEPVLFLAVVLPEDVKQVCGLCYGARKVLLAAPKLAASLIKCAERAVSTAAKHALKLVESEVLRLRGLLQFNGRHLGSGNSEECLRCKKNFVRNNMDAPGTYEWRSDQLYGTPLCQRMPAMNTPRVTSQRPHTSRMDSVKKCWQFLGIGHDEQAYVTEEIQYNESKLNEYSAKINELAKLKHKFQNHLGTLETVKQMLRLELCGLSTTQIIDLFSKLRQTVSSLLKAELRAFSIVGRPICLFGGNFFEDRYAFQQLINYELVQLNRTQIQALVEALDSRQLDNVGTLLSEQLQLYFNPQNRTVQQLADLFNDRGKYLSYEKFMQVVQDNEVSIQIHASKCRSLITECCGICVVPTRQSAYQTYPVKCKVEGGRGKRGFQIIYNNLVDRKTIKQKLKFGNNALFSDFNIDKTQRITTQRPQRTAHDDDFVVIDTGLLGADRRIFLNGDSQGVIHKFRNQKPMQRGIEEKFIKKSLTSQNATERNSSSFIDAAKKEQPANIFQKRGRMNRLENAGCQEQKSISDITVDDDVQSIQSILQSDEDDFQQLYKKQRSRAIARSMQRKQADILALNDRDAHRQVDMAGGKKCGGADGADEDSSSVLQDSTLSLAEKIKEYMRALQLPESEILLIEQLILDAQNDGSSTPQTNATPQFYTTSTAGDQLLYDSKPSQLDFSNQTFGVREQEEYLKQLKQLHFLVQQIKELQQTQANQAVELCNVPTLALFLQFVESTRQLLVFYKRFQQTIGKPLDVDFNCNNIYPAIINQFNNKIIVNMVQSINESLVGKKRTRAKYSDSDVERMLQTMDTQARYNLLFNKHSVNGVKELQEFQQYFWDGLFALSDAVTQERFATIAQNTQLCFSDAEEEAETQRYRNMLQSRERQGVHVLLIKLRMLMAGEFYSLPPAGPRQLGQNKNGSVVQVRTQRPTSVQHFRMKQDHQDVDPILYTLKGYELHEVRHVDDTINQDKFTVPIFPGLTADINFALLSENLRSFYAIRYRADDDQNDLKFETPLSIYTNICMSAIDLDAGWYEGPRILVRSCATESPQRYLDNQQVAAPDHRRRAKRVSCCGGRRGYQ